MVAGVEHTWQGCVPILLVQCPGFIRSSCSDLQACVEVVISLHNVVVYLYVVVLI